ncbi:long-chain-fatty-acid--CoA ligase [Bradyrhizobium liaoningense]
MIERSYPAGSTVRTLGEAVHAHASARPEALALSFEQRAWSYQDLAERSRAAADGLAEAGVRSGSRVAYLGKNSDDFVVLLLGAAKLGAVVVPLNWRLAAVELVDILRDAGAELLLVGEEYQELIEPITSAVPSIRLVLSCGTSGPRLFEDWLSSSRRRSDYPPENEESVIIQLYTSGTTGDPKGVLLTQRSLFHQRRESAAAGLTWDTTSPDETLLLSLTVSHIGGISSIARAFFAGAHLVVIREFKPADALRCLHENKISRLVAVPATLQALLQHPDVKTCDFSALKVVQYGASPMPPRLLADCMAVFDCQFVQVYGMTEAGGPVTGLPPSDHDPAGNDRMLSVGRPLPGVAIKIARENGEDASVGEAGEILVKTGALMSGYWHMPAETASVLRDGWLHTGDAGYLNRDGYLFIRDRIKDVIRSAAESIYPAEVEKAISAHPAVAEVAVIGVPDERWGEAVKALVVLLENSSASEADIIAFARLGLARFKVPKSVEFVSDLPKTTAGKVQRRLLRNPYWANRTRGVN